MSTRSAPLPTPQPNTVMRIMDAAENLFAQLGYDAASMQAIAERAGVSKANLFHHFSSKESLYLAVLHNACHDGGTRLHELGDESSPFAQRLRSYTQTLLASMLEHARVQRLILRELLTDGERRGQELAEKVFGESFARFVGILRQAQKRGELRAELDASMVATLLVGANVFFLEAREVLKHFRDIGFANDPRRYSDMLADILLRGIACQPAPAATNLVADT